MKEDPHPRALLCILVRAGMAGSSRNGTSDVGTVLDSGAVYPHNHKMRIPLTGHQVWGQDDSASKRIVPWPLDILRDYHMF